MGNVFCLSLGKLSGKATAIKRAHTASRKDFPGKERSTQVLLPTGVINRNRAHTIAQTEGCKHRGDISAKDNTRAKTNCIIHQHKHRDKFNLCSPVWAGCGGRQ